MAQLGDNLTLQKGTPSNKSRFSNSPPPAAALPGVKRVTIVLEDNSDIPPNGLFIGHNGNTFMIRTGMEVKAPAPLLEILDNAVVTVPIMNPNTQQITGYRQKQRFPYRVIREEAA